MQEAIAAGKPMLVIPLIADQFRNAKLGEYRGFSVTINKNNFSVASLSEAIAQLVHNHRSVMLIECIESYSLRSRARELRDMIGIRPVQGEQLLLSWTELVARFDVDLDLPNLGLLQYSGIDVIASILAILVVALYIVYRILRCYFWSCFKMAYEDKAKKE
jgi:hypothetical protein